MVRIARFLSLWIACTGGCAHSSPPSTQSSPPQSADEPIQGPPLSYLPDAEGVRLRIDFARVRRSPLAPDISSAIRASATWQSLAGRSGLDPVQDFDMILVGADELYTDRRVSVIRHHDSDAELRARVMAWAIDRGEEVSWDESSGLPTTTWTVAHSDVPYSLVVTAAHEVVLAPTDLLSRVVEVARDHQRRRQSPEDLIEPQLLQLRATEIATFDAWVPLPAVRGYPTPPSQTHLVLDEGAEARTEIGLDARFASESESTSACEFVTRQASSYAQNMLVRAAGMHRPLEQAQIGCANSQMTISTFLTTEELRRALGMMALSQLGRGGM